LAPFGANGTEPISGVIADANGDLFGTTLYGGANGDGTHNDRHGGVAQTTSPAIELTSLFLRWLSTQYTVALPGEHETIVRLYHRVRFMSTEAAAGDLEYRLSDGRLMVAGLSDVCSGSRVDGALARTF
jgi:hypothetical protein